MNKFEDYIETELVPESTFWREKSKHNPETMAWVQETISKWYALYPARKQFFPSQFEDMYDAIADFIMRQESLNSKQTLMIAVYLAWVVQEQFYDGMEPGESEF